MKAKLFELLAEEGYRPKIDEDGDIRFSVEGFTHMLDFDERDPAYVRLMLPQFWSIDDADELQRAYIAANEVCLMVKGAKVFVVNEAAVWSTVEYVVTTLEAVTGPMLARHLEMIRRAWGAFRDKMTELERAGEQVGSCVTAH
ncbi:MAG: hypothetical protein QE272_05775 [Nevskia sp.]|nr:hypothetical protein [Nevskia sp.]